MRYYFASDHAAIELKSAMFDMLKDQGHDVVDLGPYDASSVDYPDYANKLAEALSVDPDARGIAMCGTGIGISIALNRHKHIRAALCHDVTGARLTRAHNDANVLVLGARLIGIETAKDVVAAFLEVAFEGGRHQRRVDKLSLGDEASA